MDLLQYVAEQLSKLELQEDYFDKDVVVDCLKKCLSEIDDLSSRNENLDRDVKSLKSSNKELEGSSKLLSSTSDSLRSVNEKYRAYLISDISNKLEFISKDSSCIDLKTDDELLSFAVEVNSEFNSYRDIEFKNQAQSDEKVNVCDYK